MSGPAELGRAEANDAEQTARRTCFAVGAAASGTTGPNPIRIVFDRRGRVLANARVRDASAPTVLWCAALSDALSAGPTVVGDPGITGIAQTLRLVVDDVTSTGADRRIRARLADATDASATEE